MHNKHIPEKIPFLGKNSRQSQTRNTIPVLERLRRRITDHKFFLRKILAFPPFTLTTVLSLLPFILGLSQFLRQNYPNNPKHIFFEENIPGLRTPNEKYDWETYNLVGSKTRIDPANTTSTKGVDSIHNFENSNLESYAASNRVFWLNNQIFMEQRRENTFGAFENFLAYVPNISVSENTIFYSEFYKFLRFNPQCDRFATQHDSFDEIPFKVQGSRFLSNGPMDFPAITSSNKEPTYQSQISTPPTVATLFSKNFTNQKTIRNQLRSNSVIAVVHQPGMFTLDSRKPSTSTTNEKIENFDIIRTYLETILQDTGIAAWASEHDVVTLENNAVRNWRFVNKFQNKIDLDFDALFSLRIRQNKEETVREDISELLTEIDHFSLGLSNPARLMSGYRYPDMKAEDIWLLQVQRQNNKNVNIAYRQIKLPPTYLSPEKSGLNFVAPPNFSIQTNVVRLRNPFNNQIIYYGPAVRLDPAAGKDWQLRTVPNNQVLSVTFASNEGEDCNSARNSFRNWLQQYTGSANPLSARPMQFFAVGGLRPTENENTSNIFFAHEYVPLLRAGIPPNTIHIPNRNSFQLPYLEENEWESIAPQTIIGREMDPETSFELTQDDNVNVLLPLLEVRFPINRSPISEFGYTLSTDRELKRPRISLLEKLPRSHISNVDLKSVSPRMSTITGDEFPSTGFVSELGTAQERISGREILYVDGKTIPKVQFSSGRYQKNVSLFANQKTIRVQESWEPLTSTFWLITTQMSFAFLFFQSLKSLANNYGRELLYYLVDLVTTLGFLDDALKQEIEILMGRREKGFRIISRTKQNFRNIAGIHTLLPEFIEIVWFLRTAQHTFGSHKNVPRGILLTGPPGTGKTLLVQAIAGEADVPVVTLSGSSLIEPGESGAVKLELLFAEARRIAPCIVFIDEMDTLAEKRDEVIQNTMGVDELLESLAMNQKRQTADMILPDTDLSASPKTADEALNTIYLQQDMRKEKLRLLTQFLTELDGVQSRNGVVVIGATNRPEILDPAVLRPGRFDRILQLGLPNSKKREEILKLYSRNLGIETSICWEYLVQRTAGYSSADLASIMNQSTLRAILENSHHTIQTIEYGIDRITTTGSDQRSARYLRKAKNLAADCWMLPISLLQRAYYQAGKVLLGELLPYHPSTIVTHLWPRRTSTRAIQIQQNLQKYFFRSAHRIEFEQRIVGCYAGKAAEILILQDLHDQGSVKIGSVSAIQTNSEKNFSDLGIEDIQFAQNLIRWMAENWFMYGKSISIHASLNIFDDYNVREYRETSEKMLFFKTTLEALEDHVAEKENPFRNDVEVDEEGIQQIHQEHAYPAIWQYKVSQEFENATRTFSNWFRLYIPDPQQIERNLEWIPADEFYQGNRFTKTVSNASNWNELGNLKVDYIVHSLILESFNKALLLLDQNREILDKIVYHLLQYEILREPEIEEIFENFNILRQNRSIDEALCVSLATKDLTKKTLIRSDWGSSARRTQTRWIQLETEK
jgi:ATP-dependent Zn protease